MQPPPPPKKYMPSTSNYQPNPKPNCKHTRPLVISFTNVDMFKDLNGPLYITT